MSPFGTYSVFEYGFDRKNRKPGDIASPWWRYAWNQGPELISLMLDTWDWTQDTSFAREELVPMAGSVLLYFDTRFRRDGKGLLVLDPCQVIETYRIATNDQPTIAGLRAILPRLIALPAGVTTEEDRSLYSRLWKACPPLPTEQRTVGDRTETVLAPAERYADQHNHENAETYAIWPYRLYGVGKPNLELARNTFLARKQTLYTGWGYDGNVAALLGLTDEASKILRLKCGTSPDYRCPYPWSNNYDWLPDQNHAGNLMNTAQLMLLQYNGRTIYLLPAWPPAWDCQFKLHAPANTIVEGEVSGGKVTRLEVTPESRRKERRGLPAVHRPLTPVTRFSVSCEVRLPGSCSQRARLRRPVSFQDVQRSLETPHGDFIWVGSICPPSGPGRQ